MMENTKEIFKKRKKLQILVGVIGVVAVLALMTIGLKEVAVVAALGLVIFSRYNWRCPKCKSYFGRGKSPKHCPSCGEELQ